MPNLAALPLYFNVLLFLSAGVVVWIAGTRLSIYADLLADRTGLGRVVMGFVFLAGAGGVSQLSLGLLPVALRLTLL